jgi:hypothetical protein
MSKKKLPANEFVLDSAEPVPYHLVLLASKRGPGLSPGGRLTSPLLDRTMHKRSGVEVVFRSLEGRSQPVLDPFEAVSLACYLQNQSQIRRELQQQLNEQLNKWDPDSKLGRDDAIWNDTKIAGVEFAPRNVPSPEQIKHFKKTMTEKSREWVLRVQFDAPETATSFTVALTPRWAGGHLLLIPFHDGKAVDLIMDG